MAKTEKPAAAPPAMESKAQKDERLKKEAYAKKLAEHDAKMLKHPELGQARELMAKHQDAKAKVKAAAGGTQPVPDAIRIPLKAINAAISKLRQTAPDVVAFARRQALEKAAAKTE